MGIDSFWPNCPYRYLIPSETYLASLPPNLSSSSSANSSSSSSSTSSSSSSSSSPTSSSSLPLQSRPIIGIDIQVGFHALTGGSDWIYQHNQALAFQVARRYKYLVDLGFDLVFVNDGGPTLSKLASFERRAKLRRTREKALKILVKLRTSTPENRAKRRAKSRKLFAKTILPSADLIESFRNILDLVFAGRACFFQAPFQADTQLVCLMQSNTIQCILSVDSDILISGAPSLITGFDFKKSLFKVASLSPIVHWTRYLEKTPKHQLFSGNQDLLLRTTWSTILGVDNLPGGIPGIGPKKLHEAFQLNNWNPIEVINSLTEDADLISQI